MSKEKKQENWQPENESMEIVETAPEPVEEGPKKQTFAQAVGITRTNVRPIEEMDPKARPDRVGRYLKKYLNKFVFAEFSDEYLKKAKIEDIMKGVPVPLRKRDIKDFNGGNGLDARHLGENMAWIIGCDPHFKYTGKYIEFLLKMFNLKIAEGLLKEGRDAAEEGNFDDACVHFRACLCIRPDYLHGMYSYARVCRSMYLASKNEEYIGRFKAESLDYFELVTDTHPRFAQGFYYLGYAYLNMGLYVKAAAAWRHFLKFTRNNKDRREIRKRMNQIQDPINIEEGCNLVMAGKNREGLSMLEPYLMSRFKDWWPLHYYLGVAYMELGDRAEAVARFKNVLEKNGSHLETMEELHSIYEGEGDKENAEKYAKKIQIIRAQLAEEAENQKKAAEEEEKQEETLRLEAAKKEKESDTQETGKVKSSGIKRLDDKK